MADPKTFVDTLPKYLVAGVEQTRVVFDKRTVVGPASYAADGFAVDLSGVFSTLHAVRIQRVYVTSTGAPDSRVYEVNQISTDTFANRKFRVKAFRAPTPTGTTAGHTHTYDKANTPIGGVRDASLPAGVVKQAVLANTDLGQSGGINPTTGVGGLSADDATHGHGISIQYEHDHTLAFTSTATGSASPSFTGDVPTTGLVEIAATVNLSTITVEYEAVGVLA